LSRVIKGAVRTREGGVSVREVTRARRTSASGIRASNGVAIAGGRRRRRTWSLLLGRSLTGCELVRVLDIPRFRDQDDVLRDVRSMIGHALEMLRNQDRADLLRGGLGMVLDLLKEFPHDNVLLGADRIVFIENGQRQLGITSTEGVDGVPKG
jgi:hypothetical protein